jgi:hypothetical protein
MIRLVEGVTHADAEEIEQHRDPDNDSGHDQRGYKHRPHDLHDGLSHGGQCQGGHDADDARDDHHHGSQPRAQ